MDMEAPVLGPDLVAAAFADCEVREFLGVGRFGETYRVTRGDDEFALKICHFVPCMPQALWERELTALRRVDHPNVMRFRAAGHVDLGSRTCPFMECEYVAGGDLGARIKSGEVPAARSDVRALLVGLLRGVRELHELGVLHRDIRPSNVIPRDGDWGHPVLLDFGVAETRCISPAQQRLSLASRRVDLVDVAAVVYETACGCSPRPPAGPAGDGRRRGGGWREAVADPRSRSDLFDEDVAELLVRLLNGRDRRLDADGALQRLDED